METEGEIQNIKNDRKALTIEGVWYNSFKPITNDFNKGDYIKIVYSVKGDFKNIKSLVKVKKDIELNNESVKPKYISDSTINCILMQSVQFAKDKNTSLELATGEVLRSYKNIIENL